MSNALVRIRVRRARLESDSLPLPQYQTELAAGMDLLADVDAPITLGPLERRLIPTGIQVEIPAGFEGQVRPRSGLALKYGITCLNSPGTIDADYRGEVQVLLVNFSQQAFVIRRGDRVAQFIIAPVSKAIWEEQGSLAGTSRGEGGFGSTGR